MAEKNTTMAARSNWKKIFAARKFLSLAKIQSMQAPAHLIVGGRYKVGKKIANGAFGQLRIGTDQSAGSNDDKDIAIKLEPTNCKIPMLFLEFRFYKVLGRHKGFPRVHYYGPCGKYNALVMELLGPNLEELFCSCGRQFSLKTILNIAIQLLNRIEYVHDHGIIYRDIKPENVLVGLPGKNASNVLYIVDFGLAKEYIDIETGRHIPYVENKSLTGTVRYMSLNSHLGREQSRRDDLEALGHVFFYFLTGGKLPWQGVKQEDAKKRYQIIANIKEETRISELGNRFPWEFSLYLRYCRHLKFAQTPDYGYLKNLFKSCLNRIGAEEDNVFDWMLSSKKLQRRQQQFEDGQTEEVIVEEPEEDDKAAMQPPKSNESIILTDTPKKITPVRRKESAKPVATIEPFRWRQSSDDDKEREENVVAEILRPVEEIPVRNLSARRKTQDVGTSTLKPSNKLPIRRRRSNVELVRFDSCCSFFRVAKTMGMHQ